MKILKAILEGLFYGFMMSFIFFFTICFGTSIYSFIKTLDFVYIFISLFSIGMLSLFINMIISHVEKQNKKLIEQWKKINKLYIPNYNKFQLNEEVIYIDKQDQLGLYSEIAVIKFVNRSALYHPFYIQFVKNKKYMWCNEHVIKSLSKLKIKRLVEHGV